jgi:O-antigen/teichoic acid export membrane protein
VKIAGGTALGQGIVMLSTPLLTRIFSPEDFGLLAVYSSILSIVLVIACLRYEMAISLPKDEGEAAHLVVLSLAAVVLVTILVFLVCLFGGYRLLSWLKSPGLAPYLVWLLPIGVFGGGVYQTLSSWAVRQRDYDCLAKTRIYQGVAQVAAQLGLGFLIKGPVGLLVGADVGRLSGSGTLIQAAWKLGKTHFKAVSPDELRRMAKRYKQFPLVNAFSALVNALGLYLPVVAITFFYGPEVAGQFSLSQRMIGVPIVLVGQAISLVFTAESAALVRESPAHLDGLVLRTLRKLMFLGIGPVALLVLLGPWGFRIIFGPHWGQAGLFIRILAPMFFVQFLAWPLSQVLLLLELQTLQVALDTGRMIAVIASLVIPALLGFGPTWAVAMFGTVLALFYVLTLMLIRLKTRGLAEIRDDS